MSEMPSEQSEDMTILDQVTLALQSRGENAELEHTGGKIYCIRVPIRDEAWMYWGTSDEVWGCDIYQGEDYLDSAYLDGVPVSAENIPQAADAIINFTNNLRTHSPANHRAL
jgi:hypothetical protein